MSTLFVDKRPVLTRRAFDWVDAAAVGLLVGLIYAIVTVAREWSGSLQQVAEIHLEVRYLPFYALLSLARGVIAYAISFLFTMVYGYAMARVAGAERVMLPVLDILQSIPVLGFLPGFVLGLVHLFPHQNFGLEIASVLMIFTGQVWNMTFSFYSSLKSVPPDLVAVARLARMSWWERFFRLDLSFAATGLLWNSMMSMAGGWFFLMVSEAFVLGEHDFRLPGFGSYMSLAIERGDVRAEVLGVLGMLGMIVFVDQVVWRPLVSWSQKFTDEETGLASGSWLWERMRRSWFLQVASQSLRLFRRRPSPPLVKSGSRAEAPSWRAVNARRWTKRLLVGAIGVGVLFGLVRYLHLVLTVTGSEWLHLLWSTAVTFLRVVTAVALASLWTIPVGVMIGRHPRWSRAFEPIIQMAASFPAPMNIAARARCSLDSANPTLPCEPTGSSGGEAKGEVQGCEYGRRHPRGYEGPGKFWRVRRIPTGIESISVFHSTRHGFFRRVRPNHAFKEETKCSANWGSYSSPSCLSC